MMLGGVEVRVKHHEVVCNTFHLGYERSAVPLLAPEHLDSITRHEVIRVSPGFPPLLSFSFLPDRQRGETPLSRKKNSEETATVNNPYGLLVTMIMARKVTLGPFDPPGLPAYPMPLPFLFLHLRVSTSAAHSATGVV